MNLSFISDFAYIGGRPYIRGVDLLRQFMKHATVDMKESLSEVVSLKLLRELRRNGVWCSDRTRTELFDRMEASAAVEYYDNNRNKRHACFYETGSLITRSMPDSPTVATSIICNAPFAGLAKITKPIDTISVLDGLVAANKALHVSSLRDRGLRADSIRFVYIESLPIISPDQIGSIDLKITHRGTKQLDGRIFTLNIANFDDNFGSARVAICFSFDNKG